MKLPEKETTDLALADKDLGFLVDDVLGWRRGWMRLWVAGGLGWGVGVG